MPIGSSKNCLLQRSSEELSFFRSSCSSKSICASQISKIRNFCTIRKFKFLSKNSISTKPQHFTSFSPQFFWQFFSLNQSYQQPKSPKPQHFHEFFSQKKINIFSGNHSWIFGQKWRFRTVCFTLLLVYDELSK